MSCGQNTNFLLLICSSTNGKSRHNQICLYDIKLQFFYGFFFICFCFSDGWERLQLTLATLSAGGSGYRRLVDSWVNSIWSKVILLRIYWIVNWTIIPLWNKMGTFLIFHNIYFFGVLLQNNISKFEATCYFGLKKRHTEASSPHRSSGTFSPLMCLPLVRSSISVISPACHWAGRDIAPVAKAPVIFFNSASASDATSAAASTSC